LSQYPQPPQYQPPPYAPPQPPIDFSSYRPAGDLLGPSRRAGVLLLVLGGLVALMGTCNLAGAVYLGPEEMAEQQAQFKSMGLPPSPMDAGTQRVLSGVLAGLTLLVGMALAVNGTFVRRGSAVATTLGLVMTGGLALLLGLFVVMFALGAALVAPPMLVGACIMAVPLGLLAWAFIWLVAAARHGPRLAAAQQQYAAQYHQLQQQQLAYAQPGGYGVPYGASVPQQPYAPQPYGYAGPAYAPPQGRQPVDPGSPPNLTTLPAAPGDAFPGQRPGPSDPPPPPPPAGS
jgi:hypothetical protein